MNDALNTFANTLPNTSITALTKMHGAERLLVIKRAWHDDQDTYWRIMRGGPRRVVQTINDDRITISLEDGRFARTFTAKSYWHGRIIAVEESV